MNSQFPDSFWNYKNFNMVNELNIAGEFIYDGIDALNRMNTIDEIPLLFSFLYHVSVGIERIQKIILVLFGLIIQQMNWEDRKKEIENDRATGLVDVQDKDFDGDEPIYDKFNWRWLKCSNCEKLFRADQMASYGGRGSINKGICSKCSNDRRG